MEKRLESLGYEEQKRRESEEHKKEDEKNEVWNNLRQKVEITGRTIESDVREFYRPHFKWHDPEEDSFFIGVENDFEEYGVGITESGFVVDDVDDSFKRLMTEKEARDKYMSLEDWYTVEDEGVSMEKRKIYRDEIVRIYRERFPNQDTEETRKALEVGYGIRILEDGTSLDLAVAGQLLLEPKKRKAREEEERKEYVEGVLKQYHDKFRNQDVEVAKIIKLLTKKERRETLEKAIKFQSGKSEGESFIGYTGGDGNFGIFIDERGNLIDGENNLFRTSKEDLEDREIAKRKILELYKEKFPKKKI